MQKLALASSLILLALHAASTTKPVPDHNAPAYAKDGSILLPANYQEWVFLGSGIDMTYITPAAGAQPPSHSTFNTVFVNPAAYHAYLQTGTWPDKTTMVLENRAAENPVSINKRGHTEGEEITGLELHVKDKGKWAFYIHEEIPGEARLIPPDKSCYTCHEQHAAADTTFVQFYPTLLAVAKRKNTLSANYLKEMPEPAATPITSASTK